MMTSDVSVLVTNELLPEVIEMMNARYRVTERYGINGPDLKTAVDSHDVLVCRSATKVTADIIAGVSQLKLIISATSGLDHIDIGAASQAGIPVCHTLYGNTNANAENNIGTLIALGRNFIATHDHMRGGGWSNSGLLGNEISGKTLGIIGFGRIGQLTAKYAKCFNMNILVYDNYHLKDGVVDECGATAVSMTELMQRSDFVILSVPRTSETLDMVTKDELAKMKPTAYIVQASRGGYK